MSARLVEEVDRSRAQTWTVPVDLAHKQRSRENSLVDREHGRRLQPIPPECAAGCRSAAGDSPVDDAELGLRALHDNSWACVNDFLARGEHLHVDHPCSQGRASQRQAAFRRFTHSHVHTAKKTLERTVQPLRRFRRAGLSHIIQTRTITVWGTVVVRDDVGFGDGGDPLKMKRPRRRIDAT